MKTDLKLKFIEQAISKHGDKFDYSLVYYVNNRTNIKIICPEHGVFEQRPEKHLRSPTGCPQCTKNISRKPKYEFNELVEMFNKVHDNKYQYPDNSYRIMSDKIEIICPIHGMFKQQCDVHLQGHSCPECGKHDSISKRTTTRDEFIERSRLVHGDKYDYSEVKYVNRNVKVKIICSQHGLFEQIPYSHLIGKGCSKCAIDETRDTLTTFIDKAQKLFPDKFDYSKSEYISSKTELIIICPAHGEFRTKPNNFLNSSYGCPECAEKFTRSLAEKELFNFIQSLGFDCKSVYRPEWLKLYGSVCPSELDIYIPELNLAIEYNGTYWHSEEVLIKRNRPDFHKTKYEKCKENGVDLIHIFEFEDLEEWKSNLSNYLKTPDKYEIVFNNTLRYINHCNIVIEIKGQTNLKHVYML